MIDPVKYENCPDCAGSGNVSEYEDYYEACPACRGRGYVPSEDAE